MKILIADDNADTRYILDQVLTAAGHRVHVAENGKIALHLVRTLLPDLIISDILMPEMDGFQFCQEIRKDDALHDTPFVFYTATYTDAKDERLALDLGADRFIRKPMAGGDFLEEIQNVTRHTAEGTIEASNSVLNVESNYLKQFNQRLIRKLEKKIAELEQETASRRQAQADLKATLNAIPDMIFRLDRRGHGHGNLYRTHGIDIRALLYVQGSGARDGFGPCPGQEHRRKFRRQRYGGQSSGPRLGLYDFFPHDPINANASPLCNRRLSDWFGADTTHR